MELPREVAERLMEEWPNCRPAQEARETTAKQQVPWEESCGDAYKRAMAAHRPVGGFQVKDTVGPDRPKVQEPPVPQDRDGRPDSKANVFLCPTCGQRFPKVQACREHQRIEHGT